jgi:hypothetical protein
MALEDFAGKPESDAEGDDLPVTEGGSPMAAKRRAVQRMFAAAKKGDWKAAAHAFADAFAACEEYEDDDDDEESGGLYDDEGDDEEA